MPPPGREQSYSDWYTDLFLCAGEDDWYHVSLDHLDMTGMGLHVGVVHEIYPPDCTLCTPSELLPACPHNTLMVEVYDADTGALLASDTGMTGFVHMNRHGLPAGDVRVCVHGDPQAALPYQIRIGVVDEGRCSGEGCQRPELCGHC